MKVIITFTFCRGNLWKNKKKQVKTSGKAWKTPGIFFLPLCGHPANLSFA